MVIGARHPAGVSGREGEEALDIEAGDQVRDGIAGTSAGGAGGGLVIVAAGDGQEHRRASDLNGRSGLRTTEEREFLKLRVGQRPERILLATGHGGLLVS